MIKVWNFDCTHSWTIHLYVLFFWVKYTAGEAPTVDLIKTKKRNNTVQRRHNKGRRGSRRFTALDLWAWSLASSQKEFFQEIKKADPYQRWSCFSASKFAMPQWWRNEKGILRLSFSLLHHLEKFFCEIPINSKVLSTSLAKGTAEEKMESSFFNVVAADDTVIVISFKLLLFSFTFILLPC